jgi:hypothetical protein
MAISGTSGGAILALVGGVVEKPLPVPVANAEPAPLPKAVPPVRLGASGIEWKNQKIASSQPQKLIPVPANVIPRGNGPLPPPPPVPSSGDAQPGSLAVPSRAVSTGSPSAGIRTTSASNHIHLADQKKWEANYGDLSRQPAYRSWAYPYAANTPVQELYRSLRDQFGAGGITLKQRFEMLVSDAYRPLWLNPTTGPAMVAAWRQLNSQWAKPSQPWQTAKPLPEFNPGLSGKLKNHDAVFPVPQVDAATGKLLSWRSSSNLQKWEMFHKVPPHAQTYGWSDIDRRSGDRTAIRASYTALSVQYNRLLDATVPELRAKQQLLSSSESLWHDEEYGPVMHDMWSKLNSRLIALGQPAVEPPQFLLVTSPRHEVEVLPAVQKLGDLHRSFSQWLPGYNDPEPASYKASGNPKPWAQLMAEGRKELIEMRFWPLAQSYDNFIRHHLGSVDAATRADLLNEQRQLIDWIKSEPDSLAAKRVNYFRLENTLATAQRR